MEARAAFQKTASDMEYERSNLMCVINQVLVLKRPWRD